MRVGVRVRVTVRVRVRVRDALDAVVVGGLYALLVNRPVADLGVGHEDGLAVAQHLRCDAEGCRLSARDYRLGARGHVLRLLILDGCAGGSAPCRRTTSCRR